MVKEFVVISADGTEIHRIGPYVAHSWWATNSDGTESFFVEQDGGLVYNVLIPRGGTYDIREMTE